MKRLRNIFVALLAASMPLAQGWAVSVPENEPVVVYFMPQTEWDIVLEYDEIVTQVGPFYQYSERYLGTKDVIVKSGTQYALTGAHVVSRATADTSRSYVLQDKSGKCGLVQLSAFGTLAGYNTPFVPRAPHIVPPQAPECTELGQPDMQLMPLMEEQLMASSLAKMAEGAAKQLYHVREARLSLIASEAEHAPADGEALKQMLKELSHRERELTALFVGTRTIRHHAYTVRYTPKQMSNKAKDEVIIRFSKHFGIVAADDLSGEPINMHIAGQQHSAIAQEKEVKLPPTLFYNLPGQADLQLTYGERELLHEQLPVAQWGVAIPVNALWLQPNMQIVFDPMTGNIVSVSKN